MHLKIIVATVTIFPYADYKENGNPIGYGYGSNAFHDCPFKDKVTDNTKWKTLGCKYFCD